MSTAEAIRQVEYPESDGKPLAETDLHIDWIIRLRDVLKHRYRGQPVYIAADLFVYYEEGNPRKSVVPDVFVVKDCDPRMRRTYLLWEEGLAPDVVFELTSRSSKRVDERVKPLKYALIGVDEYFLFDPLGEYLKPPLAGFRLQGSGYEQIEANAQGRLECRELGITLELDGADLVVRDAASGAVLPTHAEAAEAELWAADRKRKAAEAERKAAQSQRKAAESQRKAAEAKRKEAEERAAALEEELNRLRKQLHQQ